MDPRRLVTFGGLALARPPPPVALLHGKPWVASLRDGAPKGIENTGVLTSPGKLAKRFVERVAILASQVANGAYSQPPEIGFYRDTDTPKISKAARIAGWPVY